MDHSFLYILLIWLFSNTHKTFLKDSLPALILKTSEILCKFKLVITVNFLHVLSLRLVFPIFNKTLPTHFVPWRRLWHALNDMFSSLYLSCKNCCVTSLRFYKWHKLHISITCLTCFTDMLSRLHLRCINCCITTHYLIKNKKIAL